MKSKNEKRNQFLAALIIIAYFAVVMKCSAQSTICFKFHSKNDSLSQIIILGLCQEKNNYRIVVKFPIKEDIKLRIGFINGDIEYLPYLSNQEYQISERVLKKLKTINFDAIYFDRINPLVCRNIKTKDFFIRNIQ